MTHTRPAMLLTGATSGIGLALAHRLHATTRLVLTGRRALHTVAPHLPAGALYIEADFEDAPAATHRIEAELAAAGIDRLDRVILNAGEGIYGDPAETAAADVTRLLSVNLLAPILLAKRLAPHLEAAGGKLVLVGSVAHRGAPRAAVYGAAKAGLAGLARALAQEWQGRIAVQIIHPGPTATPMHAKAGYDPGRLVRIFMTPEEMAAAMMRAMDGDRPSVTLSFPVKLAGLMRRHAR